MGKWTIDDINPNDVIIITFKNEIAETLKILIPELEVIVYPESYAGDKENLKKVFIIQKNELDFKLYGGINYEIDYK